MWQKHFSQDPQNTCKEKHLQCVTIRNIQQPTRGNNCRKQKQIRYLILTERTAFVLSEMHKDTHTLSVNQITLTATTCTNPSQITAQLTKLSWRLRTSTSPQIQDLSHSKLQIVTPFKMQHDMQCNWVLATVIHSYISASFSFNYQLCHLESNSPKGNKTPDKKYSSFMYWKIRSRRKEKADLDAEFL